MILDLEIMNIVLDIVHEDFTGDAREDRTKLELVEIRPRDGQFSRVSLSASISPNDPAKPDEWHDEEASRSSGSGDYNEYNFTDYKESGLGQFFNLRFSVDFNMNFTKFDFSPGADKRTEALEIAKTVFVRTHRAMLDAGERHQGKFRPLYAADEFGFRLVRAGNCVKHRVLRPGGSDRQPIFKGKMWLQFETYLEP